jgi:hypothetical protein
MGHLSRRGRWGRALFRPGGCNVPVPASVAAKGRQVTGTFPPRAASVPEASRLRVQDRPLRARPLSRARVRANWLLGSPNIARCCQRAAKLSTAGSRVSLRGSSRGWEDAKVESPSLGEVSELFALPARQSSAETLAAPGDRTSEFRISKSAVACLFPNRGLLSARPQTLAPRDAPTRPGTALA